MASTTVNFNLKTAGYVNYANQTLTFRLLTAGAEASTGDQSYVTLPGVVTATSAANGDGSVSLFRNGKSGIESVYEVILPNREKAKFIIPSGSATIELATLLVDHVPGGSDTQQSSVYAEAIKRANHTGTQALSTISDAGTIASQASNNVSISGGSISGITVTASTANLTDSTNKRFMTDAQETKLDSVESSADVTDATNVTAAGALMDSEVDADIKTLSLPASTTISTFAKTFLDDTSAAAVKTTLGIADATSQVNFVPSSISFTNTSSYLSLADNANLDVDAGDFTLAFWARLDSSGTEPVLTKLSGTGYRLKFASGSLILTMQDAGGSADFTLATGLNDNKWHVYVVTVDRSGNAIAYVDNVAQTGVGVSGTALTLANSGQFQIGSDGGSNAGDGIALGNYIVLHKAILSASQAAQIYFSADAALTAVAPTLMVDLRRADKTFADVSTNGFAVTTNGTIIFNEGRITSLNETIIGATTPAAVTGTNILATTTLGYTTGSGGTFNQSTGSGTGKAKTVVLNKATGQITLDNASLAANTSVAFTLTNSTIAAHDILVFNHVSGGTIGAYNFNAVASSGSAVVTVRNMTSGALTDAAVVSFAVIKAVTS